ncbi:hypothetical protein LCI18_001039 [Fusarium solani-melongenae]|uniref:Uncharacterized protein n=1 Tax=Fusarium solani subsp. cucurbitae TaxID=2747967 RepID=A0ACD3YMC5_FUSSC|nr:hypothetical protein LCI18_001039 [Fusarium solani-melongenae]
MNGEDPPERPNEIADIINGLERYNPEAVGALETYLQDQCEQKFTDCNANRTLLKLYQLNPDRIKDEVITNILVKTMTQFPSSQFSLALHLINPSSIVTGDLGEAITKLRSLNGELEGAQYARFWANLDDDMVADLIADIPDFEDLIRHRIAHLVSQAFRELKLSHLESWLGLDNEEATKKFVTEVAGWSVEDDGTVKVPSNPDNEAKKAEIREDVTVEQFSRVLRRSWEDTV